MRRRAIARARHTRISALVVLLLLAGGCIVPVGGGRTGRPLEGHGQLVRGATTKAELFDWFGAPMAIAGAGEYVEVPAETVHHIDEMGGKSRWFGGGSWVQQGDAWMELFAARQPLGAAHRVYYWYTTANAGVFVWPVVVAIEERRTTMHELWALVDEVTGIATDFIYRER